MGYDLSQDDSHIQTEKVQKRIDQLQVQVGTLATIATISLLLSLLLIILYILEVICGGPSKRPIPPPLPTAVVIQKKDKEEGKTRRKSSKIPDQCRHTLNRSFPSKKVTLELDVKRSDKKEKEAKEKPAVEVFKIALDAPPPYAESGKSATGGQKVGAALAPQQEPSAATGTVGSTISGVGTTSLPVSATQETTGSQDRTAVLPSPAPPSQPPQLDQLKTAILSASPRRARPGMGPTLGQPSLPVPAQPPTRTVLPPAKSPRKERRRTAASPRRSRQLGSGTSDQASAD
ncbi:unnamed protein product [Cylicocyclus nassatus]|uniref:Uncharacterized protein n=1 Tax=Cylicocyclus nassatus TaxID=53992 RepID=A0AA36MCT1_CYLNA|nr:unnamed protein product [Cylicocyclus nassatus]